MFQKDGKKPRSCLIFVPDPDSDEQPDTGIPEPSETAETESDDPACLRLFRCPDEACIKSYNKLQHLFNHIAAG